MKPVLFSFLSLFMLAGCNPAPPTNPGNQYCPITCTNAPIRLTFENDYTMEDIDTVIVNKYTYGSSYSQLQLTHTYSLADTTSYVETQPVGIGFKSLWLRGDYDYEIIIPATAQTFRVSGIVEPNVTQEFLCSGRGRYTCGVPIVEFSLTGGDYRLLRYANLPAYLQLQK